MVSPKPLSVFVPDVTLIAFPIPATAAPAWWQNVFLTRIESSVRVKKMVFDTDVEGKFRRKPELALAR
jgi:hypothetical protein